MGKANVGDEGAGPRPDDPTVATRADDPTAGSRAADPAAGAPTAGSSATGETTDRPATGFRAIEFPHAPTRGFRAVDPGLLRRIAVATGVTILVASGLISWWLVQTRQPWSIERLLGVLVLLAGMGLLSVAAFVVLVIHRRRLLAVACLLAPCVNVAIAWNVEDLHWRWSRADFAAVADGESTPCQSEDCRLGWWHVEGTTRLDTMVIVWLPSDGCHAGQGIAWPEPGLDEADLTEAARAADLPTDDVTVTPWRDGWYELCFTT